MNGRTSNEVVQAAGVQRGEGAPARGALILVAERDPHVRRLERYFLEDAGYTVQFADDGLAAIELAKRMHPRILITEILVAKCDGLTVCRRIKADPVTRDVVVLVVSILASADRAHEAGADGYLRKPLNDTLLVDSVRKLVSGVGRARGASDGTH